MAAKIFEVGDILPATTQLRISWTSTLTSKELSLEAPLSIRMNETNENWFQYNDDGSYLINGHTGSLYTCYITNIEISLYDPVFQDAVWSEPYSTQKYIDIDTSNYTLDQRKVIYVNSAHFFWEDLNPASSTITNLTGTKWEFNNNPGVFNDFALPVGTFNINFSSNDNNYTSITGSYDFNGDYSYIQYNSTTVYNGTWTNSNYRVIEITGGADVEDETLIAWLEGNATQIIEPSGYTITFNSNGGTTFADIEEASELPNPLPIPTKPGYTFGGWYYESNFQTRAKAGDTIEANITLYAKWLTLAQVLEHLNNVVEELRSAIIDKGGDAEGKLLIDFATIINSLKTYEVVETLAELELLEPKLNRLVYVKEGSGELAMGEPIKITQDGDTLIIG